MRPIALSLCAAVVLACWPSAAAAAFVESTRVETAPSLPALAAPAAGLDVSGPLSATSRMELPAADAGRVPASAPARIAQPAAPRVNLEPGTQLTPFQAAVRRLAAPFGDWAARPQAASPGDSKDEAGKDFESRAFGPQNDGEQPPSETPPPPAPELPKTSGPRRPVVLRLQPARSPQEIGAALSRLSQEYGYEHDARFPILAASAFVLVRGVAPVAQLERLKADPAVQHLAVAGAELPPRVERPVEKRSVLLARFNELSEKGAKTARSNARAWVAGMALTFGSPLLTKLVGAGVASGSLSKPAAYAILGATMALALGLMVRLGQLVLRRRRTARALRETLNGLVRQDRPRSPLEVMQSIEGAQAEAAALAAVSGRSKELAPILEALKKAKSPEAEALERALSPEQGFRGMSAQSASLRLNAAAAPALAAYRRGLWDDETLDPKQASAADARAAGLERKLLWAAGQEENPESELTLAAERLHALYASLETQGPSDRRTALAVRGLDEARWAWYRRNKWGAPRMLQSLMEDVSGQLYGREQGKPVPAEKVEELRDETRQVLEAVVQALNDPDDTASL